MGIDFKIKKIAVKAMVLWVIIGLFGVALGIKEIYFGVVLGGILSITNFIMIAYDVPAVLKSGVGAGKSSFVRFIRRYLVIGVVLGVCVNFGFREFIGLFLGLLIVRVVILFDGIVVSYFNEIKEKVKKYIGKEG